MRCVFIVFSRIANLHARSACCVVFPALALYVGLPAIAMVGLWLLFIFLLCSTPPPPPPASPNSNKRDAHVAGHGKTLF